jgi:hypothetical protein
LDTDDYKPGFKYNEMTDNNFRMILSVIPVDLLKKNILEVFNNAIEVLKKDHNF